MSEQVSTNIHFKSSQVLSCMRKMRTSSKITPPNFQKQKSKKYLWNNRTYVRFGKLFTFSTDFLTFAKWNV